MPHEVMREVEAERGKKNESDGSVSRVNVFYDLLKRPVRIERV